MATKKPTTTAKKRPATKTTATKTTKSATKKPTRATKASKKADYQSFKLSPEKESFYSFKITRQSVYWVILGVLAILFTWYTLTVSQSIEDIYNQIDEIRAAEDAIVLPSVQAEQ